MSPIRILMLFGLGVFVISARAGDLRVTGQFIGEAPQGTAPIQVDSTTRVPNLNADMLDGRTAADFAGVTELADPDSGVGVHWKNLIDVPVVEIDQDCAVNTGCETGVDSGSPGFPVRISESGSYRLASKLTNSDENATIISIEAPDVTLDLNGFALIGPVSCTGGPPVTSCSPSGGSGRGITVHGADIGGSPAQSAGVRILNGTVRGSGSLGIFCSTPCTIMNVNVVENGGIGVQANSGSLIENSSATHNGGGAGMFVVGIIRNSYIMGNNGDGLVFSGTAIGNLVEHNATEGIEPGPGSTAINNSSRSNLWGFNANGATLIGNAATQNNGPGFVGGPGTTFRGNSSTDNVGDGFDIREGVASGNTSTNNGDAGFNCRDCVLLDNAILNNTNIGVNFFGTGPAWGRNIVVGHPSGSDISGIVADMGNNFCDGVAC